MNGDGRGSLRARHRGRRARRYPARYGRGGCACPPPDLDEFAALGFCLPVRFRLARHELVVIVVALLTAALSAILETPQFVLHLGRVASVDDVLVNAVGAAVASLLSIRWWRSRERAQTP